jgi:hypothetical protein
LVEVWKAKLSKGKLSTIHCSALPFKIHVIHPFFFVFLTSLFYTRNMNLQILVLQLILAAFALGKKYTKSNDAVLLSNVRSLTLQTGKQTTARRVEAIPQLTCIGGSGQGLYDVDVMRCENSGSEYDAEDIQWTCKANLPPEFKLGSTDVVCEGFDSSEDSYILKGSCGVEYRLILTEMGEEKYGQGRWSKPRAKDFDPPKGAPESKSSEQSLGSILFAIVFWFAFIGNHRTARS